MQNVELKDTIPMMNSDDYKELQGRVLPDESKI